ncbi:MAG TPA: FG-GAP-like repeat-containing protein [Terriglobales bacterium]
MHLGKPLHQFSAGLLSVLLLLGSVLPGQTTPAIGLKIIVVGTEAEAQQIQERLRKGEDFAALAKEKSIDPTAENGGDMGKVELAGLQAELRLALGALRPGQISGIIRIPTGYAILKFEPVSQIVAGQGMSPTAMLPISGIANLRYPPDVSGAVGVESAFREMPKPPNWNRNLQAICSIRKQGFSLAIDHLQKLLDPDNAEGFAKKSPGNVVHAQYLLAQFYSYQGKMGEAIAQWQAALKSAERTEPGMVQELLEVLGTAYLHKSEMENEVYRKPGDRCLFPPRKSFVYKQTADSDQALQYFLKFLEKKPDDLEVKWLLNVAYLTLGKYPAGVPAKYLIAPAAFNSAEDVGHFEDVAPQAGLDNIGMAGGVIVDDFENNGLLDVVISSYDTCEQLRYYHNNGDGTFSDRSAQAGFADQLGGLNIAQADYDNDGCLDVMVFRGGWQFPMRRSLLRGNCDGTFSDVTEESGLGQLAASQSAVWADIDNDGSLDLFVINEHGPSQMFRNRGDGTFEDISHSAGIDATAFSKGVVAEDYDHDGYVDFFVSNLYDQNFLYHNNHNLTFTEVAKQAGVEQKWRSFAAWFFDYDNDGWPDLFVTTYPMSADEALRSRLGMPNNSETLKLYRNLGNGTFKDVSQEVGLDKVFNPMGANFGDIDNDGFLDFYMGVGTPPYGNILPAVLFRNVDGKHFEDVTTSSGTGEIHKGHGVAFADVDRDGDEDIFFVVGGAVPGDAHAFRLFENPGDGNDWINLKLVGVKTNRAAIGARIKVTVENEGRGTRSIYRTVGSGGSFGASPLEQHIGLGKSARILQIETWWPVSHTHQTFTNVEKDQFLQIRELDPNYTKLERKSFTLGGARPATAASKTAASPARKQ